ncbi:MAG: DHH family phosphoesterase [Candidatus Micrarchaeota archaeon]
MLKPLERLQSKPVLITFHSLGDVDAVGSAFALSSYFKRAYVVPADTVNSQAKHLMKALDLKFSELSLVPENASVIVLDTSSKILLAPILSKLKKIDCIIDHHALNASSLSAQTMCIKPSYSSASEIISELLPKPISERAAICLLAGIITDSAQFQNASARTFRNFSKLLALTNLEYKELLELLDIPQDISMRLAVLKSAQRAQITREGDFLIASSLVGSFEPASASALVSLGADVAFVGSSGTETKISARMHSSRSRILNLAELMIPIGKLLGGSGGGHACAAGANGPKKEALERALSECVSLALQAYKKAEREKL